jgi:hypothetical protein
MDMDERKRIDKMGKGLANEMRGWLTRSGCLSDTEWRIATMRAMIILQGELLSDITINMPSKKEAGGR